MNASLPKNMSIKNACSRYYNDCVSPARKLLWEEQAVILYQWIDNEKSVDA